MKHKGILETSSMPSFMKGSIMRCLFLPRIITAKKRVLPDFIIIGVQKGGTTSLYNYLIEHPLIAPASKKEINFFNIKFRKGIIWNRAHFPLYKSRVMQLRKQDLITGESSPYYIFHPHAPRRISRILPQVKLITLLRNPVDRTYSHYQQNAGLGIEPLSLEEVIEREGERLCGEREKMLEDEDYYSIAHQRYSYLARSVYLDQLKLWMRLFPKEQILILKSEDLFNNPPRIFKRVIQFLNLPDWELKKFKRHNPGQYSKMDTTTRKHLIEYFEPHNQRLYEFLGVNFDWK